jgi:hypothetical protein
MTVSLINVSFVLGNFLRKGELFDIVLLFDKAEYQK